ncbi:MAG: hypothetical protein DI565_12860 [Ancylobacter novellus]|uniref:Uncharacterized protein n=1 Tax=Ancylobacter novellus TaxID=921 RepID=A0A2W5KEX6_ANCNO|nr:MAG: hypothetical protein DI565_12860 [Ancylobacter novellus]
MFLYDYAMPQTAGLYGAWEALRGGDHVGVREMLSHLNDAFVGRILEALDEDGEEAAMEAVKEAFEEGPDGFVAVRRRDGRVVGDAEMLEDLGGLVEEEDDDRGDEPELEECDYASEEAAPYEVYRVPGAIAFEPGDSDQVEALGEFLHYARWLQPEVEDDDLAEVA